MAVVGGAVMAAWGAVGAAATAAGITWGGIATAASLASTAYGAYKAGEGIGAAPAQLSAPKGSGDHRQMLAGQLSDRDAPDQDNKKKKAGKKKQFKVDREVKAPAASVSGVSTDSSSAPVGIQV